MSFLIYRSPKKPKSKRIIPTIIPLATTTNTAPVSTPSGSALPSTQPKDVQGTPDSPIVLMSDTEMHPEALGSALALGSSVGSGLKRKASLESNATQQNGSSRKKRKMVEIVSDFSSRVMMICGLHCC